MSEWPEEAIGTMPSVPQPKPLPQKPSANNNLGIGIGLLLCGLCLAAFPQYAPMNNMGTGIFYGMSLVFLLIALIIMGSGRNKRKLSEDKSRSINHRKMRRIYINRFFVLLVILGLYVVAFPTTVALFYALGFMVLLSVIFVIYGIISRRAQKSKQLEVTQAEPHTGESQLRQTSSNVDRGLGLLFFLLIALFLLVFPKFMENNDLIAGIFYGAGLVALLLTIMGITSEISKFFKKKAIPA